MASFTDSLNRSWNINITVFEVKKLKDEFGLDLNECSSSENKVLSRLDSDTVLLVDVLSCLLEEQIEQLGLTDKQFVQGIFGVGINNATEALVEAIINFSKPREGRLMRVMWNKMQATQDLATERVLDAAENLDIDALVTEQINEALKKLPKKSGG